MKISLPLTRSNVHNVLSTFVSLIKFNAGKAGKTGIGNTVNTISASLLKTVKAVMHSFMAAFFVEKRVKRFVLALFVMFVSVSFVQAQTLTSDQADYPPGSTVTLTGSSFGAGDTVTLEVVHADGTFDNDTSEAHVQWTVIADAKGNFTTNWFVPADQDESGALLLATANGQPSGLHAQTTFTDAAQFKAEISSISGFTSQTQTYTITITNANTANTATKIGSVRILLPSGYTFSGSPILGTPSATSGTWLYVNGGSYTNGYNSSSRQIGLKANNGSSELAKNDKREI